MKKILLSVVSLFLLTFVFVSPAKAATTSSLVPVSDGAYTQLTPSTGSTHYTLVDESSCNGTTDYNFTNTVGNRDSYGISLSSIPDNSTITQISFTPCASNNKSGSSSRMNVFYRLNGVDSIDIGNYLLSGTTPTNLSTNSFVSLSITKTSSTILEIGAVLSSGTKGMRLSRISTIITYTPPAPSVTTNSATSVGTNTATLNSTVNPNGVSTTVNYRYGTVNTSCDLLSSSTSGTLIGAGTSNVTPNARIVTPLSPSTTYYYCAVGSSAAGTVYGGVLSFTTLALPTSPTVTTNDATNLITIGSSASADLNSTVNPNGASTTVRYRYGTVNTSCNLLGNQTSSLSIGSGYSNVSPNTKSVAFLPPSTTFYFCAVATNSVGTTYGDVLSFTTLP